MRKEWKQCAAGFVLVVAHPGATPFVFAAFAFFHVPIKQQFTIRINKVSVPHSPFFAFLPCSTAFYFFRRLSYLVNTLWTRCCCYWAFLRNRFCVFFIGILVRGGVLQSLANARRIFRAHLIQKLSLHRVAFGHIDPTTMKGLNTDLGMWMRIPGMYPAFNDVFPHDCSEEIVLYPIKCPSILSLFRFIVSLFPCIVWNGVRWVGERAFATSSDCWN